MSIQLAMALQEVKCTHEFEEEYPFYHDGEKRMIKIEIRLAAWVGENHLKVVSKLQALMAQRGFVSVQLQRAPVEEKVDK